MAISDRLELLLTADPSNLISAMDRSASAVESRSKSMESSLSRIGSGLLKAGGAGIGIGGLLTQLGSGEQEAEQQLSAAIKGVGQSVDDYKDRIDKALSTEEKFGQGHEETDRALQTLTTAYGDTGKALDRLQLVTDIAAARHISLAQAADIVARAHAGSAKAFKLFGEQVVVDKNGNKDYEASLDNIAGKLNGQAAASVDSFSGHLRVLGTEVKDRVAELGENFGPAILGVSTGLTALGGITSGIGSIMARTGASAAALTAENEALAVSEDGIALNSAAAVEGLYAESAAADAATTSTAAFIGVATLGIAAIAGLAEGAHLLGDALFSSNDSIDQLKTDLSTVKGALSETFGDASQFNPQKLVDGLTNLVRTNQTFGKALVDAKTNTGEFALAIIAGGNSFATYADKIGHAKGVTDDDRIALTALTKQTEDMASGSLTAAVASGQLSQKNLDASAATHKLADGTTDYVGVINDLASKGQISAQAVNDLKDAAGNIDPAKAKELDDHLKQIRADADSAQQAALQLAPADVRVQQGKLTLADDQARVQQAQDKLKWDKAAKASASDLAQDQRDLERAQLDVQTATNDQATALADLHKQQIIANGGTEQQDQYNRDVLGSLEDLNSNLTGPMHDAMAVHILDLAIATNHARDLLLAEQGIDPNNPALRAGANPIDTTTFAGGPIKARAGGGDTSGLTLVGEHGPELVNFGAGGHVYNNADTQRMMGSGDTYSYTLVTPDAFAGADEIARMHTRRRFQEAAA